MKISEILKIEQNNTESIFLFKEGIFYRCYEISAWHFINNVKVYKVFKKYVKVAKQDVIYLGFPQNILDELIKEIPKSKISENENYMEIQGFSGVSGFEKWKVGIPESNVKTKTQNDFYAGIITKIKQYPIVNKTPVEVFNFLVEIKKELEHG